MPRIDIPKFLDDVERLSIERQKQRDDLAGTKEEEKMVDVPEIKETISFDEFLKLDLRIATVLEAEKVAGTDKLVKLQLDLGREKRQIIAGIAKVYTPESLVGKQIVIVANLEPRKMRGEMSQGMLLATGTEETVTLLIPEKPSIPGDTVH